jgi:hypothetical protein
MEFWQMVILKYIPLGVNLLVSFYLVLFRVLGHYEVQIHNNFGFDLHVFRIFHAEHAQGLKILYFVFLLNAVILLPFIKGQNNLKILTAAASVLGWILFQSTYQHLFPW